MTNLSLLISTVVIAQAEGAPEGGTMGLMGQMLPLALMFLAIYFLLIRPMGKRKKEQQQLVSALKKDDQVITNSGIHGKIYAIEDHFVLLEIADKVRIRVLKTQVATKFSLQQAAAGEKPAVEQ